MLFSTINAMCSKFLCSVVIIVVVCFVGYKQEVLIEESSAIESLHSPTGGAVELPCDVTPSLPDDRMGLVIWYKKGHETPIYSFDIREGVTSHWSDPSTLGARATFRGDNIPAVLVLTQLRFDIREGVTSHWSDPSTLGARATFRGDNIPAVLVLTQLRPEDSGQYRCRVDFIKSPTKNTRLNLTILIPPERLIVLNQEGEELKNGVLGPYDEGIPVNLTCVAVGGHPTPRVSWWKAHELLANSEARATVSFTLQRADHGTHVTCQAVTDPSIPPVSEVISIDVNLRLLWLRLVGGARPLVAGQAAELVCQAVGARPKPSISWWKGGTRLKSSRETISSDGNITSSVLTLVPVLADAGRVVSCRAVQRAPLATYEDGWTMEIQHVPMVTLELGANLDASKVVEGSDVYLDCRVKANPWHSHVYFTHNGIPVKPSPGVLLANQSLVLQKVSRKAAGDYVCVARNSLGEGSSEKLKLDVKYTPTCRNSRPTILRAAKREIIDIDCDVEANPNEPLHYQWWFNSSSHGKLELPATMLNTPQNNQLRNYLYMVNSSSDYGWIQCSASNSVGRQESPCLFRIQQADKPSQVKDCEITNVTYSSLSVRCIAGHDGGVRQTFLMQIMDMSTGSLLRNVTSDAPEFRAPGLPACSTLSVSVSAYNKQGASAPVSLTTNLLKFPQQTALVPVKVELTTVLLLVLASVAAVAALAAMSAAIVCCTKPCRPTAKNEKDQTEPGEMLPSTGKTEVETFDSLDKNPDIIPTENRNSDNCSNQSSSLDYLSIRPLVSNCSRENYDVPSNCERFYNHNIDYNQFVQVRPMATRIRSTNQSVTNFGPRIQSVGKISSVGLSHIGPNECYRETDKTIEDWLKYKSSLPLSTSGLLPTEQLMPLYPPPLLYSNPRPIHLSHMKDLEHGYNQESRFLLDSGSCSSSPPVRFQDNSVYFNNSVADVMCTLPNSKR